MAGASPGGGHGAQQGAALLVGLAHRVRTARGRAGGAADGLGPAVPSGPRPATQASRISAALRQAFMAWRLRLLDRAQAP